VPEREFRLAAAPKPSWRLWALALIVHFPAVWILTARAPDRSPAARPLLFLARPVSLAPAIDDAAMRYHALRQTASLPVSHIETPAMPFGQVTASVVERRPVEVAFSAIPAPGIPVVDTPPTGRGSAIAPHFVDGRIWVQPLPMTPQEMVRRVTGRSDIELVDSAVDAIIQQYLDQMAEEQAHLGPALPSWTTSIGGKTVGVDQKWIYLGPIKVPTMLLALLPINLQGNPTQAEYNRKLNAMREDLFDAARRSANFAEFKRAVKELHDETERKREFKRNTKIPPADTGHGG
jgi:hypothetical protein